LLLREIIALSRKSLGRPDQSTTQYDTMQMQPHRVSEGWKHAAGRRSSMMASPASTLQESTPIPGRADRFPSLGIGYSSPSGGKGSSIADWRRRRSQFFSPGGAPSPCGAQALPAKQRRTLANCRVPIIPTDGQSTTLFYDANAQSESHPHFGQKERRPGTGENGNIGCRNRDTRRQNWTVA